MKIRIYEINEIQKVYTQHHRHCGSVLYSENGYNWQPVGMDTGKWDILNWKFAFIKLDNNK